MVRKRLTGMIRTPLRAATSEGTAVPVCRQEFPGTSPATPLPAVASPRAWLTSAPPCDTIVGDLLTGATEDFSRDPAARVRVIGSRAMRIRASATEDTWHARASGPPEVSLRFRRFPTGKDVAGGNAREKWGGVFTTNDAVINRLRGSGEVVPWPSTTTGSNQMRDTLRDSGAASNAAPGAFPATGGRDTEIPADIGWANRTRGYWLFGGGIPGGPRAHPLAPRQPWNCSIT